MTLSVEIAFGIEFVHHLDYDNVMRLCRELFHDT